MENSNDDKDDIEKSNLSNEGEIENKVKEELEHRNSNEIDENEALDKSVDFKEYSEEEKNTIKEKEENKDENEEIENNEITHVENEDGIKNDIVDESIEEVLEDKKDIIDEEDFKSNEQNSIIEEQNNLEDGKDKIEEEKDNIEEEKDNTEEKGYTEENINMKEKGYEEEEENEIEEVQNIVEKVANKDDITENVDDLAKESDNDDEIRNIEEDHDILRDNSYERDDTEGSKVVMVNSNNKNGDLEYTNDSLNTTEEKPSDPQVPNANVGQSNSNEGDRSLHDINNNMLSSKKTQAKEDVIEFDHLPQCYQNRKPVSALTPTFSFGYNRHVPIINLSTDKRCFIFYSASHLAIVFDYFHNEQMILQGHSNSITCTTASRDKRWLATGDKGENSVVIIWDCNTGLPVRSMFEPHPNGVIAISLTPDARYLASLSAENQQTFAIWDWTTGEDIPLCSSSLSPTYDVQNYISFNEDDIFQVSTNSDSQVLFYQWDKIGNMKYFAPKLTDKDFNKQVGKFSNTVFLPKTTKAISATSQGLLVVWEGNIPLIKVSSEATPDKKAIKLVPVHEKGINVLTLIDSYIVTGDVSGDIKFFDFNFMLIFWYKDWNFGPITSISPSNNRNIDRFKLALESSDYPGDATIENNKFFLRDFIVGTSTTIFATVTVEGSKIKIIFREHDQLVFSVAAHPTLPLVATGSYSGLLKIWDYEQKRSLKTRFFEKVPIKCMCFDHTGLQLAVGFTNGEVRILDTHALSDVTKAPFHFSKVHITHILFSERSEFLATVDANCTATVYRAGKGLTEEPWVYLARYRAHYKPVVDLIFGRYFDTDFPRMFTLGSDRRLVEYDLSKAYQDHLPIAQEVRIEQRSVPLTMCWYPEENGEGFLVTANDEYKLKMYNHQTKMCRFTLLGPTFGSPVKILKTLPPCSGHPKLDDGSLQRYVAYANQDKIGLMRLPFDGNPYNYMTMIAHPRGVTNMCCSFDGNYLISVGEDFIVTVWKINADILETQARLGGSGMTPYYELIEGGEFGSFMHELKDYFYYSMIRTQGIDSLETRKVTVTIEIGEVPYIMRGIGFYPSEEEIENMMNQLKFKDYFLTGEGSTKVDMDTFLKLYINHRPAFGIPSSKIDDAFRDVFKTIDGELTIDKFFDLLINRGENMKEDDLAEYLATLVGFNSLGGSLEMETFDPSKVMTTVNESLPKIVTSRNFIEDILCMKIVDKDSLLATKVSPTIMAATSTQT